jgi:hypothetical protein
VPSVGIHPPKTPVTTGSHGIAKATIPNVCKMPGPPAPFVPTPLPNIAKSELSPKGYSTSVKIEGDAVAIRGATFESMGDIASKGTGGGLISANTHGPAKFIGPGSMTVKIEGKSVHLLGEPMLNNCGPSGSPPNTGATMMGVSQGRRPPPPECPPHDIKWEPLTPEGENARQARTEATKKGHRDRMNKNMYDAGQAWKNGDVAAGDALFQAAQDAEGQMEDTQLEQDVAKEAKAQWTGVKYWCTKCNFKGEIDVFTEKGVVKECKSNGRADHRQMTRHLIAAPEIFGAVAGFHLAIPAARSDRQKNPSVPEGWTSPSMSSPIRR